MQFCRIKAGFWPPIKEVKIKNINCLEAVWILGESPLQALHREVFEETGWCIAQPHVFFRFKTFCFMPDYDLWAEKVCTIYAARPVYRKSAPTEPDHHSVILPIEAALSHLASDGDRHAVAQFFGAISSKV